MQGASVSLMTEVLAGPRGDARAAVTTLRVRGVMAFARFADEAQKPHTASAGVLAHQSWGRRWVLALPPLRPVGSSTNLLLRCF